MKKKKIKLTCDNIQYYLRDLTEWANDNGFSNAAVVINYADDVIDDLKEEIFDLKNQNEELRGQIVAGWQPPEIES